MSLHTRIRSLLPAARPPAGAPPPRVSPTARSGGFRALMAAACTAAFLAAPATRAQTPLGVPGTWTLTFQDEFNSGNAYVDGGKWRVGEHWAGMNGSGQLNPALVSVSSTVLCLSTSTNSTTFAGTTRAYGSSEISTFKTFRQLYGYFECRAKFPAVTGMWPAFWLMPDRGTYGYMDNYYESYVKFDLSGATIPTVTSAQLKLTLSSTAAAGSNNNLLIMKLRNDSWTEGALTWNNKPAPDPAWIKSYYNQAYTLNQVLSTDVTAFVAEQMAGDKKISFVLADKFMRCQSVKFYSRRAATQAYRPQLVVNGTTYYASEDAYAQAGTQAGATHATGTTLIVRDDWGDCSSTYNGGMEFDIMESLGIKGADTTYETVHWNGYGADHQSVGSGLKTFAPTTDGFHTYGINWQPGKADFYIDGTLSWSYSGTAVASVPEYILLSSQLGGWDSNNPGPQVHNQVVKFDYVRVWTGTAVALPAAPSGLTATAASNSQINLAWTDNATNETGFKVERKTTSTGTYAQIATTTANAVAFSNTGLAANTTYFYRVRATNTAGNSAYCTEASATTLGPPAAPTGLTITTATMYNGWLRLNWTDKSSTETGFRIESKTSSNTWALSTTVASNTTSWTRTGLSMPSGPYTYRVCATNSWGLSGYSNEVSASLPTPPAGPTGLTATAGNAQVVLTWTAVAGANNYNIKRATTSGGPYSVVKYNQTGTTYTNTGLTNGTTYYYVVSWCGSGGESRNCAEEDATPYQY